MINFYRHKLGFTFRAISKKQHLLFNISIGVGKPINSFAKHSVWLFINGPQKIEGIKAFRGLAFQKVWGSLLDGNQDT
jgi:hypothetical protein